MNHPKGGFSSFWNKVVQTAEFTPRWQHFHRHPTFRHHPKSSLISRMPTIALGLCQVDVTSVLYRDGHSQYHPVTMFSEGIYAEQEIFVAFIELQKNAIILLCAPWWGISLDEWQLLIQDWGEMSWSLCSGQVTCLTRYNGAVVTSPFSCWLLENI